MQPSNSDMFNKIILFILIQLMLILFAGFHNNHTIILIGKGVNKLLVFAVTGVNFKALRGVN